MEKTKKLTIVLKGLNLFFTVASKENFNTEKHEIFNSSSVLYSDLSFKLQSLFQEIKETYENFADFEENFQILMDRKNVELSQIFFPPKTFKLFPDIEKIKEFKKNYNLLISHSSILNLFIDKTILSYFGIEEMFTYQLEEELEYFVCKNPKQFLIMDSNIFLLRKYYEIGCWTCLLTYNYLNLNKHSDEGNNKAAFKKYEYFFDFTSISFFNQDYYIDLICEINADSSEVEANKFALQNKIKKLSPLFVLVLTSTLCNFENFSKSSLFISDKKVFYQFYFDTAEVLKPSKYGYNLIVNTLNEPQFLQKYEDLFEIFANTNQKFLTFTSDNISKIVNKELANKEIANFTSKYIKNNEKMAIKFAKRVLCDINTLSEKAEKLINIIITESKGMTFVKYSSKDLKDYDKNHQLCIITSEEAFSKFIKSSEAYKDSSIFLNFDKLIENDGFYVQANLMGSSIDISIKNAFNKSIKSYIDEEHNGIFYFRKNQIDKIATSLGKNIKNLVKVDEEQIKEIAFEFQKSSGLNFFGLDIIIRDNVYYIIDCTYFPSYEERKEKASEDLRKQLLLIKESNINI